ncbi:unnamed protein product [Prunus armeniaca]
MEQYGQQTAQTSKFLYIHKFLYKLQTAQVAQEVLRSLLFGILEYGILNPHRSSPSSLRHQYEGAPLQPGGVHRLKVSLGRTPREGSVMRWLKEVAKFDFQMNVNSVMMDNSF